MADNVTLPGTGQVIATKDNGGQEYQIILLADGSYSVIGPATSAKQLADGHNVNVSNMIPAVETGLATAAKQLADKHGVKIVDSAGNSQGLLMENNCITTRDYLIGVGEGDIPDHAQFSKLGYSPLAPSGASDVTGHSLSYVFPAAAQQMEAISSSVQDLAAGSGVKTIRIYYLKNDYTEATTDVIMNGTSGVLTGVSDIFRINNVRVIDFGATSTLYQAAGKIDIRNKTTTTLIYSCINIGNTRARNSIYTVPEGHTLFITSFACGVSKGSTTGNACVFTLRATYDDKLPGLLTAGLFFMPYAEFNLVDQMYTREFHVPLVFSEHTDMKVSANCGQSSTILTSSMRGWLET